MTDPASLLRRTPPVPRDAQHESSLRELFWHNVMREILTTLSMISASRPGRSDEPDSAATLFDGRLAILTHAGERIPIADVFPLFACGIDTDPTHRDLSLAVECTVFQIRTPDGHVFTLPLHEMRAFHALSPELMAALEESARRQQESQALQGAEVSQPFGFAAFRQLTRDATSPPPDSA